ncbi:MAG: homoserine dehydrogenase [Actinobacteria bacterium]|nr:MAG: homoserine dehydrogenase [Actinomycetota bacterium]
MDRRTVNISLLGAGTVGGGVWRVITEAEDVSNKIGAELSIRHVLVKDLAELADDDVGLDPALVTDDPQVALADPEVDVVVELIGGVHPALEFILRAIGDGKHVVTANKELMANHGAEILDAAEAKGVDVRFEASVGGGIPIIHPLKESLAANRIKRVMGIVNGTTNYVLSKMTDEWCSFDEALEEAKALGYAEADPSADLSGRDAAAKITILASIAFNTRMKGEEVFSEGIYNITADDIAYAAEVGYVIKLIALAQEVDGDLDVRVHPMMIPSTHPLAPVSGNYNAIFVQGDAVGDVMFFGQGAGRMPTASSVVGDIYDIARNIRHGCPGRLGCTCFREHRIRPIGEVASEFYLRLTAADRPGVLARVADAFGRHEVSLSSVIQKQSTGTAAELIFLTHPTKESDLRGALAEIGDLEVVSRVENVIRVES